MRKSPPKCPMICSSLGQNTVGLEYSSVDPRVQLWLLIQATKMQTRLRKWKSEVATHYILIIISFCICLLNNKFCIVLISVLLHCGLLCVQNFIAICTHCKMSRAPELNIWSPPLVTPPLSLLGKPKTGSKCLQLYNIQSYCAYHLKLWNTEAL